MTPTTFKAVQNDDGNAKWQSIFNAYWPAYRSWYQSKKPGSINASELDIARNALKLTLPELVPIYEQLCDRVNDDSVAMQFLTMHQPPAYLINCSQAVFFDGQPILIRNYDLSPELSENTIFYSQWQGRGVMTTSECLWGADDGINDAGLAISLTFGGRKDVGIGFGIPLILRYVLQTCETVKQAIAQLKRIPSHMAYNVTVVDKFGDFATVMLIPDQEAIVTRQGVATNHQQAIVWPEQAVFSRTQERKRYLESLLKRGDLNEASLVEAFHRTPLYSTNYSQNFGTVYTAVFKPLERTMAYHWPNEKLEHGEKWAHGFDTFNEGEKVITLGNALNDVSIPTAADNEAVVAQGLINESFVSERAGAGTSYSDKSQFEMILGYIPEAYVCNKVAYKKLKNDIKSGSQMSWAQFASDMQQLWV